MQFLVLHDIFDQVFYLCYSIRWCDQVGIQSVFEDVKAWRIATLLWKFIPIADRRGQERCIVKTRSRMQCL